MAEKGKKNTSNKEEIIVLLDVHAIIHRAYHALPNFATSKGEPTGALYGVCAMLLKIIEELHPDHIVACYDLPSPTFRHEAYEAYKKGRKKADDDLVEQIKRSREIFEVFNIPMYDAPGFEADDILGTIVEQLKKNKHIKVIIASGDMDTLQLVEGKKVQVYTLKKGINDTILYDEKAVKERFSFLPPLLVDYKGLRGDPSDHIIGIAGIGEKTATDLITSFGTIEDIYKKLKKDENFFLDAGVKPRIVKLLKEGEDEALFSKTLATIRVDAPVTFQIPKKKWGEMLDMSRTEEMFRKFEFRTMPARLRAVASSLGVIVEDKKEPEVIDPNALRNAKIALWILDSDKTNPSLEDIYAYANKDTFKEASLVLVKELKKQEIDEVYYNIELPIIPILDEAMKYGVKTDILYLKELSHKYHADLSKIEKRIWKSAGVEFNINSPKQLGEVLFDTLDLSTKGLKKTAGGARSTRESEIIKLRGEHPIIDDILAYRELQKLLSTYIDTIPSLVDENGRLHTSLHQTGTTTGRMSSSEPNMQNIPAKEGLGRAIRKAFIAPMEAVLVALDYSQIEMRVLAVLSKDKKLTEIFKKGEDVHAAVAGHVFGVPENEVTKDMRRKAKVINFGIAYGMGVSALKENLGGSRAEAQTFYDSYFKSFPDISEYFDSVKVEAGRKGYTETLYKRRRYIPSITSHIPYIRAAAERMAMNAPIQGTAADLIKIATKKVDAALDREKMKKSAQLLLQIHDELIYEVQKKDLDVVIPIIKKEMEEVAELDIPFLVTVETGGSLGDMKEYNKS